MQQPQAGALRRRLPKAAPLVLELEEADGGKFSKSFRLCLDYNASAYIKDKTGVSISNVVDFLTNLGDPRVLSAVFYAAILAHNPEFRTFDGAGEESNEGLEVVRSYMDDSNSEAIAEAIWAAYLISQPPERRKALEKMYEEAKAKDAAGDRPQQSPTEIPSPTATNSSSSGPSPVTS
jgi:hypothetical protein